MKKSSPHLDSFLVAALALLLISSCKKEEEKPDPDAIPPHAIRITAAINAPGVQPSDVYRVIGLFERPNQYSNLANNYIMSKKADGTYSITISGDAMLEDPPSTFRFFVSRNGQLAERDANCQPIEHSFWKPHHMGKEFKITVQAFQTTGNCP